MYEITPYAQIREISDESKTPKDVIIKILASEHSTLHGLLHQRKGKKKIRDSWIQMCMVHIIMIRKERRCKDEKKKLKSFNLL